MDSDKAAPEPKTPVIMIADDDFFMRGQVKVVLSGIAEIVEVDSGAQVFETYKKINPVILILDIHMPQQDGKSLLKEVLEYDPNAYVIMISADSQSANVEETRFVGAKGFVAKPFTKSSLLKYVLVCPALQKNPSSDAAVS